jgi:hypothetical protein
VDRIRGRPYLLLSLNTTKLIRFSNAVEDYHSVSYLRIPLDSICELTRNLLVPSDCDMLVRKCVYFLKVSLLYARLIPSFCRNMDDLFDLPLQPDQIAGTHACTCNPRKLAHYPKDWYAPSVQSHHSEARPDLRLSCSSPSRQPSGPSPTAPTPLKLLHPISPNPQSPSSTPRH